jgi:putative tricarboxylic transport membrane protein
MLIARGDVTVFFTRPISGVLLSIAIILLIVSALPKIRRRRDEVFVE